MSHRGSMQLEALAKAGVRKVVVVTHEQYIAQFKILLGDGSQFGIELLEFAVQAVRVLY